MTTDLLALIKSRQDQEAEFNYGIQTADRYVSTLATCVGSDLCYRYGSTKSVSFNDALKRAGRTLTYSNPEMRVKDVYSEKMPDGIEIPKHALMVFKHILTTPRKDRDGDILRTKGARPDPAMLMLWQHVHTLPIGKSLGVAEHNEKQLVMYSAIVDVNELAQDAAVMIANKMGRFSHGFKALEFSAIKEGKAVPGKTTGEKGFDVTRFEIMEESLVSVPANVDAETLEVYLDLIEGEKLTSSIMKSYGKSLRTTRSDRFPGMALDEKHATEEKGKEGSCGCGSPPDKPCGCGGKKPPSEKTDDDADKGEPDDTGTKDDKGVAECPECGVELEDGECPECGYVAKPSKEKPEEEVEEEKSLKPNKGMSLSSSFYGSLPDSWESVQETLRMSVLSYMKSEGVIKEAPSNSPGDYAMLISTNLGSAIVRVEISGSPFEVKFYKVMWELDGNKSPKFTGAPKEVQIQVSADVIEKAVKLDKGMFGTKAGRVLSKGNYEIIKEVHDGMEELHEHCSTRSGKALCQKCQTSLKSVLDGASKQEPPELEAEKTFSLSNWLADSSPEDRKRFKGVLEAMESVDATQRLTKQFRQSVKKSIATEAS